MLNERLETIANQITKGQTMADVGTDHGLLPLFLWEKDICPKVVMTDVSKPSLNKAMEAFKTHFQVNHAENSFFDSGVSGSGVFDISNKNIHFRCGDGLDVIDFGEVDVVVIAGMGGVLMTQILGADLTKTLSFDKYILQPRNGSGKLRFWLEKIGFEIESECLAEEGKFICEILVVKPPQDFNEQTKRLTLADYPDDIKYEMPRNLQSGYENIFNLFINNKLNIEKNILNSMVNGEITDKEKINRIKGRIEFLEGKLYGN